MALRFIITSWPCQQLFKSTTDAVVTCLQKNFVSRHTTSWSCKHVDRHVVHRDDNTGALMYSTDFTNIYYHPNPAHIRRKNPVFDGHVLIDLGTYQSLDED